MHSFEVHSNESACRKSGRLGLEQVLILIVYHLRLTQKTWARDLYKYVPSRVDVRPAAIMETMELLRQTYVLV